MKDLLLCGDAIKLLSQVDDNTIDLTLTSPPYDDLRVYNGNEGFSRPIFEAMAKQLYRVTKDGGVVVWVTNDKMDKCSETGTSFSQAVYFKEVVGFCLHDTMIYAKANPMPRRQRRYIQQFEYMFVFSKGEPAVFNPIKEPCAWAGVKSTGKYFEQPDTKVPFRASLEGKEDAAKQVIAEEKVKGNIWTYFVGNNTAEEKKMRAVLAKLGLENQKQYHPAVMNIQLARDHVKSWTNRGGVVLDPMCGSGTTLVAAKELERQYIGFDICEEYIEIAKKRLDIAQPIVINPKAEQQQWIKDRIKARQEEINRLEKLLN